MVHRMARRVLHAALLSWRAAAQERRVRRTAIVRFIQVRCLEHGSCAQSISNCLAVPDERIAAGMLAFSSQLEFASHLPAALQRWDAHRKAAALAHWRRLLAERREAEDNLKRCLIRKRVAFRLFRHWYWESFDDDMQVRRCVRLHSGNRCGAAGLSCEVMEHWC